VYAIRRPAQKGGPILYSTYGLRRNSSRQFKGQKRSYNTEAKNFMDPSAQLTQEDVKNRNLTPFFSQSKRKNVNSRKWNQSSWTEVSGFASDLF
jgi:hypothetical protein